jgi:hypothetical protein
MTRLELGIPSKIVCETVACLAPQDVPFASEGSCGAVFSD